MRSVMRRRGRDRMSMLPYLRHIDIPAITGAQLSDLTAIAIAERVNPCHPVVRCCQRDQPVGSRNAWV